MCTNTEVRERCRECDAMMGFDFRVDPCHRAAENRGWCKTMGYAIEAKWIDKENCAACWDAVKAAEEEKEKEKEKENGQPPTLLPLSNPQLPKMCTNVDLRKLCKGCYTFLGYDMRIDPCHLFTEERGWCRAMEHTIEAKWTEKEECIQCLDAERRAKEEKEVTDAAVKQTGLDGQ
ncbi:hypothetical protein BGZ61DRAFT_587486 [Ilyonectria robusta]|uniref:uncharacterized protein n=1 Tax=Ilyonectria robusta TaxID=1079257 RepID=UPI001E8D72C8|nr:uncharacterized protein BGZ61DRAFT_587486 [Ilyonectria robusta]KAH8706233.1 hypothetical protein BGZ61DRAFT_587486 [Ilyonectria robusta]